jgi:heme/copper-type cytochrome/quinol oxidase subunit 2
MFKKEYIVSYLKWGSLSALAYCIPMIIFLSSGSFQSTWLLFLGSGIVMVVIAAYMLTFNKSRGENASTQTMMAAGHIATIVGIIISCIVAAILLPVFIPDIFSAGKSAEALEKAPAQTGTGKTNGLVFILFMTATIGSFCFGSFASFMIPYTARRNQTKDNKSEVLNN